MTTGVISVTDLTLYIDPAKDGNFVAMACVQNASLEISREQTQRLCKGQNGATYKPGLITWSLSVSGLYAYDQTQGADALIAALKNGDLLMMRYSTGESGDKFEEGIVTVSSVNLESSGGDNADATYSGSLQGHEVPVTGTIA